MCLRLHEAHAGRSPVSRFGENHADGNGATTAVRALGALRRAKEHMHAAHDFGGHRVEALRATDEAIRQLELCLKFDKD
ncbi:MAG: hypothetical protein DMG36_10330 [Acidobacteria bacterium]|nr:MAG: hypothetical protein DMG36_10330 [Acidobacteriota bacterium]